MSVAAETLAAISVERPAPHIADIVAKGEPATIRPALADRLADAPVDAIVQSAATRQKRLLIADMDSTIIAHECIDELADMVNLKPEVSAITERAMRGDLDFVSALEERVALLRGVPEAAIDVLIANVIRPSAGAQALVSACRAAGVRTVLVSGGFMQFAEPIAQRLGMDAAFANRLLVADGFLTGMVDEPVLGPDAKLERMHAEIRALSITSDDVIALGDGANDRSMVEAAGLGIGYRPKPALEAVSDAALHHADLSAVGYAMGLPMA